MEVFQVARCNKPRLNLNGLLFSMALIASTAKTKIGRIEKQTKLKKVSG